MVTQVEAYRCDVCGLKQIWTKAEAERHEAIPESKRLPKGYVFYHEFDKVTGLDSYRVVTGVCTTIEIDHGHNHLCRQVYLRNKLFNGLTDTSWMSSVFVRESSYLQVTDPDFKEFKDAYDLPENQKLRDEIGFSSGDLTNKL